MSVVALIAWYSLGSHVPRLKVGAKDLLRPTGRRHPDRMNVPAGVGRSVAPCRRSAWTTWARSPRAT